MGVAERVALVVISVASTAAAVGAVVCVQNTSAVLHEERQRAERDSARDEREKKRDERAAALELARTPKPGPLNGMVHLTLARTQVQWTNLDANETRYRCGKVKLTAKATGVSAESSEVCSGALPPHSTAVTDVIFDAFAIAHACGTEGIADACTVALEQSER